jgi:hypothetical protein
MLSTPELRQSAAAAALCLPLADSLASAQTRQQQQQPDTLLLVNARRDAQQTLPAAKPITPEGGRYGSRVFVTNNLIATNKNVVGCGSRSTVSIACQRRTFPATGSSTDLKHALAPVRVTRANTKPLAVSTRGLPALVRITGGCLVADNRRG